MILVNLPVTAWARAILHNLHKRSQRRSYPGLPTQDRHRLSFLPPPLGSPGRRGSFPTGVSPAPSFPSPAPAGGGWPRWVGCLGGSFGPCAAPLLTRCGRFPDAPFLGLSWAVPWRLQSALSAALLAPLRGWFMLQEFVLRPSSVGFRHRPRAELWCGYGVANPRSFCAILRR